MDQLDGAQSQGKFCVSFELLAEDFFYEKYKSGCRAGRPPGGRQQPAAILTSLSLSLSFIKRVKRIALRFREIMIGQQPAAIINC